MAKTKDKPNEPESTGTEIAQTVQERIANRIANINTNTPQVANRNISVKGSKFRIPEGPVSDGPLNCIILDYVNVNAYYKEDYVEGVVVPPDCWATNRTIADMAPPEEVKEPIHENCADCPYNEFESKGRGKMCNNGVSLAIIPTEFKEGDDVYTIKIAAKGLKRWGEYVRELGAKKVDPLQVETSISFLEGVSYPSLKFRTLGPNPKLEECGPLLAKAETMLE